MYTFKDEYIGKISVLGVMDLGKDECFRCLGIK
ncbi:hypothetical protein VP249E411_P0165 [Vibrio phage 249E41-1]|nr:hypothetical protein VP249E411_P0165 [Vibrio phage 249E41-1]